VRITDEDEYFPPPRNLRDLPALQERRDARLVVDDQDARHGCRSSGPAGLVFFFVIVGRRE
jgi:hypothetical protein